MSDKRGGAALAEREHERPEDAQTLADPAAGGQAPPDDPPETAYDDYEPAPRHRLRHGIVLVLATGLVGAAAVYTSPVVVEAVDAWFGSEPVAAKPACQPTVVTAPAPSSFALNVYNGNDQPGQAGAVAKDMEKRDFVVKKVANDPILAVINGAAQVRYGTKGLANATVVSWQVQGAQLVQDWRKDASVDLVLGVGFRKLVPAVPKPPPEPGTFTVNVYNTTFRSGLASEAATTLENRDFRIGKVSNDPLRSFLPDSVGTLRYGEKGESAAKVVAEQLPGLTMTRDARTSTTVDLVLGNEYTSLLPTHQLPLKPERKPEPVKTVSIPCR